MVRARKVYEMTTKTTERGLRLWEKVEGCMVKNGGLAAAVGEWIDET